MVDPEERLTRTINRRANHARPEFHDLSPLHQSMVTSIRQSWYRRGYPPTIRELGAMVGLRSPGYVHRQLAGLEELGWVRKQDGKMRTLKVAE